MQGLRCGLGSRVILLKVWTGGVYRQRVDYSVSPGT